MPRSALSALRSQLLRAGLAPASQEALKSRLLEGEESHLLATSQGLAHGRCSVRTLTLTPESTRVSGTGPW